MAIVNGYCSLAELKTYTGISGSGQDENLENAVETASREIDRICNRIFYQTSSQDRYYTPIEKYQVLVDDISTTSGLVVKIDDNDDGSHNKTLTIDTDFYLTPVNVTDTNLQYQPYTCIKILKDRSSERFDPRIVKQLKVTAAFGFSSPPDAIKQATLLQATRLFKRKDSPFSVYGSDQTGNIELLNRFDPDAMKIIKGYIKRTL
tara:strand:+ start:22627 stop:23241 length:615 start_codon:yes stop_codon:yes gene_type:complete